ncbi:MAG: tRNA-intron lyase [Candidatus Nanoarchaeia archaeon]|nr:tRNA-intron lyase [Candidatus Nanoarchaeia archaeon]MDD5054187.1 tRNA-intron lyase [Candidatus Nanoarchaeia archaeon]
MQANLINDLIIINDEALANSLHSKGFIGNLEKKRLELSGVEAFYLLSKNKIKVFRKKKELTEKEFADFFSKKDKRFIIKCKIFSDLRNSGFIVKTALKYGFDFRVYDKGSKIGQDHAKWLAYCISQNDSLKIIDYSRMIRVCHSVKKSMILGIIDDEGDATYFESHWEKMK